MQYKYIVLAMCGVALAGCGDKGSAPAPTPILVSPQINDVAPSEPSPAPQAPDVPKPELDTLKTDLPKIDAPKVDAKTDTPKTDLPKIDEPNTDLPKIDAPKSDIPKTDLPKVDKPAVDTPPQDNPKIDTPANITSPKIDTPVAPPVVTPMLDAHAYAGAFESAKVMQSRTVADISDEDLAKAQAVVEKTNQLRAEQGLMPLVYDAKLSAYATVRAHEVVQQFAHTRPDGREWSVGVHGLAGENLAAGSADAEGAVKQWQDSPAHYENIITPDYQRLGVGVVSAPDSEYKYYWSQIFGGDSADSAYFFAKDAPKQAANSNPLGALILQNRTITLPILDDDGVVNLLGGKYQGLVGGYGHTRFGVLKEYDAFDNKVFYQGNATKILPSGQAHYVGQGMLIETIIQKDDYGQDVKNIKMYNGLVANVDVDFAHKSVQGVLSHAKTNKNWQFLADIGYGGFVSKENASVAVQGGFFGDNAQELAGVFRDETTGDKGAFGAVKK